jgi:diguanylate cyclase (GGDEF)-like protein/PAS domain S-box-containing protein
LRSKRLRDHAPDQGSVMTKIHQVNSFDARNFLTALRQPTPLVCVLMIAVVWAALYFVLLIERQRSLESAVQQGGNLVRLFEENTSSMLRGVDRTLLLLRQEYEEDPGNFDINRRAKRTGAINDLTIRFLIVGLDGHAKVLSDDSGTVTTTDLSDREWFKQQRNAQTDELVISIPIVSRITNKWTIILSRRLHDAAGNFAGTIAASVDPQFIESFYKTIDIGIRGSVLLRNLDGVILASDGTVRPTTGRQVLQPALRKALAKSKTGYYWGGGAVDGINRLVSYRMSYDLPIVTMLGLAENDIFASYDYTRMIFVSTAIVLTLLLGLAALIGIRHHLRLTRSLAARHLAEKNLEHAKRFLDTVIENLPLPVVVKDPNTLQIQLVNRAYEAFTGLPRHQLIGQTVRQVFSPEDAESIIRIDHEAARSEKRLIASEFAMHTPKGLRVVTTTRLMVRGDNDGPSHLITMVDDITDRRQSDDKIYHMAHHDALTGLANRTTLTQKIEDAAARQRRHGDAFTVLVLDLDRFKYINDTLGHPAGDALLREVASRLKAFLRETDVLARLGGDEFAIIQAGETNQRDAARLLAERIINIIAMPFTIDGNEVNIGTSLGIALAPEHAADTDSLLKMGDMALYRAKSAGRNGYCFFDPAMSAAASTRHELENELRHAIPNGEFTLHYQSIVDTQTRKVCGVEALIRWQHPTKGIIPPDQFIPLAEETGLIIPIGEWVLHTACAEAARWPADVKIAVNLSPVQFRTSNLPAMVKGALAASGLAPQRLELEITETALIQSPLDCLPSLRQFKELGITVALDDFGTGYSSLSQLMMFEFDKIKIDKSFIANMTKRAECAAIISATLTLAHSLNIKTTAEGVETIDQYRLLRLAGVTSLQGYLFKRPGPAAELDFSGVYGDATMTDAA